VAESGSSGLSGFFGLFSFFGSFGWERDKPDKPNQPDKLSANRPPLTQGSHNTAVVAWEWARLGAPGVGRVRMLHDEGGMD
jgi:hypothetical protein